MKKLLLCLVIALFCFIKANAQCPPTVTINYDYSYLNSGTQTSNFSYYVSSDGYLYYTLLDGGSTDPYYDTEVTLVNYWTFDNYTSIVQYYGGNIIGSLYIGTEDCEIALVEGSGLLNVENGWVGWSALLHIDFHNDEQ